MKHSDFKIGTEFILGTKKYRCTDIGTRVIVCINIDLPIKTIMMEDNKTQEVLSSDPHWFNGPPYAVVETIMDEFDLPACEPI